MTYLFGYCEQCGKDMTSTSPKATHKKYCSPKCRSLAHYHRNKDAIRVKRVWGKQYGISVDDYNHMMVNQSDRCAICLTDEKPRGGYWFVDHSHETGKVRGLLCSNCNSALGMFKDETITMTAAIRYLESAG